jgi:penicillin amidase
MIIPMRWLRRALVRALAVLLVVLFGVFGYLYAYLRSTLPPTSGTVTAAGLGAPVDIDFDTMGIPQVWATTERDAYFALGWLHAADRLFQLELLRRAADGRLSELFGEVTLQTDIRQRRIGHRRLAQEALAALDASARVVVDAYVGGINAYLATGRPTFEFRLLGATPAPWSVEDVLTVASFQAWYSDSLSDVDEFMVRQVLGGLDPAKAETLLPEAPVGITGHVARWMMPDRAAVDSLVRSLKLSQASNAWAIAPSKSDSRHAMLACDPHTQGPDLPDLWYIAGLHAGDTGLDVVGITAPGVPGVVMGHSRLAAWGMTASGVDLRDHYLEKVNPDNPDEYLTPDGWQPFERRSETIAVRDRAEAVTLDIKWTRHGPVVAEDERAHRAVAWRWAGFDFPPAALVNGIIALPHAADWAAFWRAVGEGGAGAFNWVFAGANGEIAYGMGSPVPIRPDTQSVLPVDGSTTTHDWRGYYPVDRKPTEVNPPRGWVANANNAPDTTALGYQLAGPGFDQDRILRIRQILEKKERFDVEDMMAAQLDPIDLSALRWRDDAVRMLKPLDGKATSDMRSWDGSMAADSSSAAIVNTWLADLNQQIFGDEMGRAVPRPYFETVLARPDSPWYDDGRTPQVERRDDILGRSMRLAFAEAKGRTWGQLAHLVFAHPMARVPVVGTLLRLERGRFAWGGSPGSLNANFYHRDARGGFVQGNSPAWRQIVDFGDLDNALVSMPAGQSGNPMSPHFFDFWPLWRTGSYWKVPITRDRVEERLASKLVIQPGAR